MMRCYNVESFKMFVSGKSDVFVSDVIIYNVAYVCSRTFLKMVRILKMGKILKMSSILKIDSIFKMG
jgi:hypothetical protein